MIFRILVFLSVPVLLLTGCRAWNVTKDVYRGYVLPAEVDVHAKADVDETVKELAASVTPVDQGLESLLRSLRSMDSPTEEGFLALLSAYPWLNGAVAFTPSGRILQRVPEQSVKQIHIQDLLQDMHTGKTSMDLVVVQSDLGPEMCVINPMQNGGEVEDYVAVHFDPRSLVQQGPRPDSLLLVHQGSVVWSGLGGEVESRIQELNWEQLLQSEVQGDFVLSQQRFGWLARYIGVHPLVYVVRIPDKPVRS